MPWISESLMPERAVRPGLAPMESGAVGHGSGLGVGALSERQLN